MLASGKDVILELFGARDPLGAVAAYDGRPFPASAVALEDSSVAGAWHSRDGAGHSLIQVEVARDRGVQTLDLCERQVCRRSTTPRWYMPTVPA